MGASMTPPPIFLFFTLFVLFSPLITQLILSDSLSLLPFFLAQFYYSCPLCMFSPPSPLSFLSPFFFFPHLSLFASLLSSYLKITSCQLSPLMANAPNRQTPREAIFVATQLLIRALVENDYEDDDSAQEDSGSDSEDLGDHAILDYALALDSFAHSVRKPVR